MSDVEDNPFQESTIANPFNDPDIQQIATKTISQLRVDEYNPFDKSEKNKVSGTYNQSNTGPAIMQPSQESLIPPKSGQPPNAKPTLNIEEIQKRQAELERKEKEWVRRESASHNTRRNNWPPLSDQCCFQPCFYQDIEVDIPLEFQEIIRQLYYLWIFHGILMIFNVIGGILLGDFHIIGVGLLYTLFFIPASYLFWFRPAYKAFRSDSSFNFMVFFFVFFFQFIVTMIQAIGMPSSGTIGIVMVIKLFSYDGVRNVMIAMVALLIAIGFICATAGDLFLIMKIHRMYHSTGVSFARAQQEFTMGFLQNQYVRSAASNVATSVVHSTFNQNKSTSR